MNDLKIFSGQSNEPLAKKICNNLNIPLGEMYRHTFPSGEKYVQFKENIRGADVFLVQGAGQTYNNDYLMELLVMSDAARRASAKRITAVMPMMFYSRSDKKDKSRTPISAKLVLDLTEAAGVNRILTMDLHSPQIGGFTNLPFDHLTFEPVLIEYIKSNYNNIIVIAPDVGAVKRAEKYAASLKCGFGFISKLRIGDEEVKLENFVGDVKDKNVILIDDMTESCGTLTQAAKECKNRGALTVRCAVTHALFTETGMHRLCESGFMLHALTGNLVILDEFIHSNTVNYWWKLKYKPENIKMLDVSGLFAKAIKSIHNNESISELF